MEKQSIRALAYQALIPVVPHHLGQPGSRSNDDEPATITIPGLRSKARSLTSHAQSRPPISVWGTHARVSRRPTGQKDGTIASQLRGDQGSRVARDGLECAPELCFVDDGYTGDILIRPGLERRLATMPPLVSSTASMSSIQIEFHFRKYAYPGFRYWRNSPVVVLRVVFLRNPPGRGPEENLLLQVQGIDCRVRALSPRSSERCRRGKQYAARHGSVNVLSGAPLRLALTVTGKHARATARSAYQVVAGEAQVVRKIFEWVEEERCSIGEVCRRLQRDGVLARGLANRPGTAR